jgi:hypothetical protein
MKAKSMVDIRLCTRNTYIYIYDRDWNSFEVLDMLFISRRPREKEQRRRKVGRGQRGEGDHKNMPKGKKIPSRLPHMKVPRQKKEGETSRPLSSLVQVS